MRGANKARGTTARATRPRRGALAAAGIESELELSSRRFNRASGVYAGLPRAADMAYIKSLMVPVTEPGKMANWIGAPKQGWIKARPVEFEYVRKA